MASIYLGWGLMGWLILGDWRRTSLGLSSGHIEDVPRLLANARRPSVVISVRA